MATPQRPTRIRKPPTHLQDYVTYVASLFKPSRTLPLKPFEPNTLQSAMKDPRWVDAMKEEIQALHSNNTWVLVPRPT